MAKRNIFKEAKAYRKLHPNTPWANCIKNVSGKKVSGVKKKTAVRAKKVSKGSRARTIAVSGMGKKRTSVVRGVKPMSRLQKGTAIIGKIDTLEKKYVKELHKDKKFLIASEINLLHDKLDALKKAYKRA